MSDETAVNDLNLSVRAASVLNNADAFTVGDVRMLVKEKKLQRQRGCGPVVMDEIMKCIGLTPSGTRRTVAIYCPHCHRRIRVNVKVEPLGHSPQNTNH